MDINPEDKTTYTTQYQEVYLEYVQNEYCAKHRWMSIIIPENVLGINLFPSAKASGFGQLSFDWYDLSSDDEEHLTPDYVAEMTPRRSDGAARLLTAPRLDSYPPPEEPKNWAQDHPNLPD